MRGRRVKRVAAVPVLGTGKTDYRVLADWLRPPTVGRYVGAGAVRDSSNPGTWSGVTRG